MRGNGIIVGAGIVGSAIAAELARRGVNDLHVVDVDLAGPLSSTERNAGGVRHLWSQSVNVELARVTLARLREIPQAVGFQQTGYLWLFPKDRAEAGETLLAQCQGRGLAYEAWDPSRVRERYPFLDRTDDLAFGLFGSRDGLINSNSLKNHFREEARKRGVTFHDRLWVTGVEESGGRTRVGFVRTGGEAQSEGLLRDPARALEMPAETGEFSFVILAGGPWLAWLLGRLGAQPPVKPVRRQICVFKAEDFDMTPYGMVVDTSGVYFHPEGGNILSGFVLKDEPEGYRFHYDDDFFESHIWPALYERSSKFERLKFVTGWSGLYSYTPDTTGILGKLPGFGSVYEAHSFTGRGVMQSHGAAVALAELVVDGRFQTIDAACLSRERFRKSPDHWLPENLHI